MTERFIIIILITYYARLLNFKKNKMASYNPTWGSKYGFKPLCKRAKYGYVSRGVRFFKKKFLLKYNLSNYSDKADDREPLVMFGLYYPEDYSLYRRYKGEVIVVWCGNDARTKLTRATAALVKSRTARHIAMGKFISNSLKKHGIANIILPVCPTIMRKRPVPRGDKLYFYGRRNTDLYGDKFLPEIERRTGLEIIKTYLTTYTSEELQEIYSQCFLGLRLTLHDGLPNTVVELGLMGRRSIYNGGTPHSIPWTGIDDICESIMKEYKERKDDNTKIANDWENYLNINDKWMYL